MTKEQFTARYQELLNNCDFMEFFNKYAKDILSSGAIDLDRYEDNYRLPKMVLCVALKAASWQYTPLNESDKKTVRNLEHF